MLGEMITMNQAVTVTNVLLTLSVSTLFLFQILSVPSEKVFSNQDKKWMFKPLSLLIFSLFNTIVSIKFSSIPFVIYITSKKKERKFGKNL